MSETVYLSIYADAELRERVDRMAEAHGRSRSNQLRWIVERGLEAWEQERQERLEQVEALGRRVAEAAIADVAMSALQSAARSACDEGGDA